MPIHLESFVPYQREEEISNWIFSKLKNVDNLQFFITEDQSKVLLSQYLSDAVTQKPFGKIVYTLETSESKGTQLLDVDILLNNTEKQKVKFLNRLPKSSKANEYYDAVMASGLGHFQLETVNRDMVEEEIEGIVQNVSLSAFPFGEITIWDNMEQFNAQNFNSFDENSSPKIGFDPHFMMPASMVSQTETYSFFLGKVMDIQDVSIDVDGNLLDHLKLLTLDSGFGTIPAIVNTDNFDLSNLKIGKILEITADIKADLEP